MTQIDKIWLFKTLPLYIKFNAFGLLSIPANLHSHKPNSLHTPPFPCVRQETHNTFILKQLSTLITTISLPCKGYWSHSVSRGKGIIRPMFESCSYIVHRLVLRFPSPFVFLGESSFFYNLLSPMSSIRLPASWVLFPRDFAKTWRNSLKNLEKCITLSKNLVRQLQNSPGHSRRSAADGCSASALRMKVLASIFALDDSLSMMPSGFFCNYF